MKQVLLFAFVLNAFAALCQHDTTTIKFCYLEKELSLISKLSNIQYIAFECSDTNMRGRKFVIAFDEYENGKIIRSDESNLNCKTDTIPMIVGKDTMLYILDECEKITFMNEDTTYKIRFAGKWQNEKFKLTLDYPAISKTQELNGGENYSLRAINCSAEGTLKIPLNKLTPVLAYTPPFDVGNNAGDYCILGTEDVKDWYKKFKVKHYYIICLRVQ